MIMQTWVFDRYSAENEQNEHATSRKTTNSFCCQ